MVSGQKILLEGTQGTSLSLHHGDYPHVTTRDTTAGSNPLLATGKHLAVLSRSVAVPWLGFGVIGEMNVEINAPLRSLGFLWARDRAGTATSAFAAHLKA